MTLRKALGLGGVLCCLSTFAETHDVPLFMAASDTVRQGFVRVINHSDAQGTVEISAVDDTGHSPPAVTLTMEPDGVVHFNSNDLERGNANKGLSGGVGTGSGDWRLTLDSSLVIETLAYVRSSTGFVTPLHDVALVSDTTHYVPIFNPGSNVNQQSKLRMINPGTATARVTINGLDDRGQRSGTVSVTVGPRAALTLTSAELEAGPQDAEGALGDGQGKWRLYVAAAQPIQVMSLLDLPGGYLSNLSASRLVEGELATLLDRLRLGAEDHGDTRADATELTLGGSQQGQLDDSEDVDVFRIQTTEAGTLTAYTTGSTDTVGRLTDSDGTLLASNDDGGEGTNFRIEENLRAGVYYIEVSPFADGGAYTIHARFVADDGGSGMTDEVNFVGVTPRQIATSYDGTGWTVQRAPCCLRGVAYGDGLWVAVGSGVVLTSEDGRSWTQTVAEDKDDIYGDFHLLNDVAHGNAKWTAVGHNAILTSNDGLSWEAVFGDAWEDRDDNLIAFTASGVAYGNGLWVAVGINNIFESLDGRNWRSLGRSEAGACGGISTDVVAYGDGRWYATGYSVGILACTRTPSGNWVPFIRAYRHHGWGIEYGGGDWVAGGNDGIATWEGGADEWYWVELNDGNVRGIAYRDGRWVVGTSYGPYYNAGDPKQPSDWIHVPTNKTNDTLLQFQGIASKR